MATRSVTSTLRSLGGWASLAGWTVLVLLSSAAWYLTGRGLAFRLGLGELSVGVGIAFAAIVALTLLRWAGGDAIEDALAAGRCPSCRLHIESRHEHASGSMPGREIWACDCGFGRIAPLTCARCAA